MEPLSLETLQVMSHVRFRQSVACVHDEKYIWLFLCNVCSQNWPLNITFFSFFIVAMVINLTLFWEERTKKYSEKLQFYSISNTKFIKYCKFHKESFVIFKNNIFLNISMHYWKIEKLHYLRSVRNKMVFFLFKGSVIKKAIVK